MTDNLNWSGICLSQIDENAIRIDLTQELLKDLYYERTYTSQA